jgi:hypothetical protein
MNPSTSDTIRPQKVSQWYLHEDLFSCQSAHASNEWVSLNGWKLVLVLWLWMVHANGN